MTGSIKPGLGVDFLYRSDYINGDIEVRQAVIYEAADRKIIVSQSDPPVLSSHLHEEILLTYLLKSGEEAKRFGFIAVIEALLKDYELASRERVPAILIRGTSSPEPVNVRSCYRLKPPTGVGPELVCRGEKLNILDISIGGARFTYRSSVQFAPRQMIHLGLYVGGKQYEVDAEVLMSWVPENQASRYGLKYATVRFVNTGQPLEDLLGKEIFRVERQMLAQCRDMS